jgi:hypothetical protein
LSLGPDGCIFYESVPAAVSVIRFLVGFMIEVLSKSIPTFVFFLGVVVALFISLLAERFKK